jgi:hypothetical protein
MSSDYRSGYRSSGGYPVGATGSAVTNHEMNSVAYVPNVGFVAYHDSQAAACISQNGKLWGPIATDRVLGELPLFPLGGTVWGVDTAIVGYEKIVAGDVASYPHFVNQKLGVTYLTDSVNCWASSGSEILLLEQGGYVTVIPIEPAADAAPSGAPSAPVNVGAIGKNARAVVSFSAPLSSGTSPVTGYSVQYSSNNGATWTTATSFGAGSSDFTKVISSLTNGFTYVFRVAAVNASGVGTWSKVTIPITPTITPPTAPYDLILKTAPTTIPTFLLSWSAPLGNGGSAITGYRIEMVVAGAYFFVGATATPTTHITIGTSGSSGISVASMKAGASYSFRVTAVNGAGPGDPSVASQSVALR